MDDKKREQIEKTVKQSLEIFSKKYVAGYAREQVKQIIEARGESEGDELQLLEPQDDPTPLLKGTLSKRGAVRKNWKQRYFVVQPSYVVEYYESEDKFNAGAQPKGTINLAGYKIVTEPNKRKMDLLKEKYTLLKLTDAIPEYTKYPPFLIECFRSHQRRWLIQCKDQAEFDLWVPMLKDCCSKIEGRTETDPACRQAFDVAFEATRGKLNVPYWKRYGGAESEMLSELVGDDIVRSHLGDVFAKLEGPAKIRMLAADKVEDTVRSMTSAAIGAGYKAMRGAVDQLKPKIKSTLEKGVTTVMEPKDKIVGEITTKVSSIVDPVVEKVLKPLAAAIFKYIIQPLVAAFKALYKIMKEQTAKFLETVSHGGDMEKSEKEAVRAPRFYSVMNPSFAALDDVFNKVKEVAKELPGSVGSELGDILDQLDDKLGLSDWFEDTKDSLRDILKRANFTYAEQIKEKSVNSSTEVDADVDSKFKHDAHVVMGQRMKSLLTNGLDSTLKAKVLAACDPLVAPMDSLIPDAVKEFLSVGGCLDDVLSGVVEDVTNKTVDPAMEGVSI